jgi:hypothetical protein
MVADSFPFSNEALRLKRDSELLLSVLGGRKHVIFEESHLGTVLAGSVGQLLRRYRLEGAALTLVLLAVFFLWRSAVPLVPARDEQHTKTIQGRGEGEALTSLLRRGITPGNASEVLLGIWRKSAALLPAVGAERRGRIERELADGSVKDVLAVWRRAHELTQRRT